MSLNRRLMLGAILAVVLSFGICGSALAQGRPTGSPYSSAIFVRGNPNGVVKGLLGQIAVDSTTGIVYQNTTGQKVWVLLSTAMGAGTVDGTGTATYFPKWSDANTLTDSLLVEGGGYLNLNAWKFYVDTANGDTGVAGGFYAPGRPATAVPSIDGDRTVAASTVDNVGAVRGLNHGTYNTTAADLFAYGVTGRAYGTRTSGANALHNWGVYGFGQYGDSATGVSGYAYEGASSTQGGGFRGSGLATAGTVFGVYGQADTDHATAPTMGVYGRSRTGNIRVGTVGMAEAGGSTTNIGLYGTNEAYTTTFPAGTWAAYLNGPTHTVGAATFASTLNATGALTENSARVFSAASGGLTSSGNDVSIATAGVTLAKMADLAADTIIGRANGAGTGVPTALTATQVRTVLGLATVATSGSASDLGTGTLPIARIADGDVTLAKQANLAADTIVGRANGAGTGVPTALTATQVLAILPDATATVRGIVPTPPNNTTTFLRGDATFAVPVATDSRITVAALASDYTNATTTPSEVTGLATSLATGTYQIAGTIVWQGSTTTPTLAASLNFDGTATMLVANFDIANQGNTTLDQDLPAPAVGNVYVGAQRTGSTAAGIVFGSANDSANADMLLVVTGTIIVTVTGNLELWGKRSGASGTVTIKAGSSLVLTKVQ